MKKCANCGLESPDDTNRCPSCNADTFVSSSPEALGHIISPEEQRFWDRMTFRHFAVFIIRLQALWFFFDAIMDVTYLAEYLTPYVHLTLHAKMIVVRIALYLVGSVVCIRFADPIASWFIKDMVPKLLRSPENGQK